MWRIAGVLLAIALIAILAFGIRVEAETVTWTNATTYTDGAAIPAAKQAQLSTEIQYKIGAGAYTAFGTAVGGASTFAASPYVTPGGTTSLWRLRTISVADNNSPSAWSTDYPFARAFQAPVAPSPVSVQ
jgi:hypothetical protein